LSNKGFYYQNKQQVLNKFIDQTGTLMARDYKGFGNQEMAGVLDNYRVRKLTEREYLRLQGFPEDFEIVCSPSQTYKQAGNAVSVPVARAIAERIRMFLLSL
jgi:site-specific DNA-cytosine methylase